MRLRADNEVCEAHGQCAMVDDELFTLDEDGYIALGDGIEVTPEREQAARLGAAACPMGALRVE
ncbi:ferredoxin [Streptosporangium sp. CA-115845]|uniref:ferredoxin n=1 Tax=Streptosporangium sp. CA-115845 TaxID=3240071 RepID=UPI003D8F217F